jgi:hypothetical protein
MFTPGITYVSSETDHAEIGWEYSRMMVEGIEDGPSRTVVILGSCAKAVVPESESSRSAVLKQCLIFIGFFVRVLTYR